MSDKGIPLPKGLEPVGLLWDNDQIFISSKKIYVILNKRDGGLLQSVTLMNQPNPHFTLSKNKMLIVNNNNCGYFMDSAAGQKKHIVF